MRNTLIILHRWVALVVGAILFLTALSGATLVFEGAIDRALNPTLWRAEPAGTLLPIDTLVARVEAQFPTAAVNSVGMSSASTRAWTVGIGAMTAFVNPHTGAINGTRTQAESQATLARRLHVFHVELFAGRVGREVVGVSAIVALFLVLTGIVLWWPDKLIRVNTAASWKRVNFDLHHLLGICAALILLLIAASGMVIHYQSLTRVVKSLDATPPPAAPAQPPGPAGALRLSFDAVVATARGALPGAEVMNVSMGGPKNPVAVGMRFPEDRTPGGRSRVFVDRYSGVLLAAVSTRDAQLGTRVDNMKRSMHTGDIAGNPTRAIWFLATLVLASQFITGVLMWWNARAGRRQSRNMSNT